MNTINQLLAMRRQPPVIDNPASAGSTMNQDENHLVRQSISDGESTMHKDKQSNENRFVPHSIGDGESTMRKDEQSTVNHLVRHSFFNHLTFSDGDSDGGSTMDPIPKVSPTGGDLEGAEPLTITQKKDWAKLLYTTDNRITIPEIAARVNLPEEILEEWVKQEGLEELRYGELAGRDRQLRRLYSQLNALNEAIDQKPYGARYPDSKQADVLSKISSSIKGLESEVNLSMIMEAGKRFITHVREVDFDNLRLCLLLYDSFVQKVAKQQ